MTQDGRSWNIRQIEVRHSQSFLILAMSSREIDGCTDIVTVFCSEISQTGWKKGSRIGIQTSKNNPHSTAFLEHSFVCQGRPLFMYVHIDIHHQSTSDFKLVHTYIHTYHKWWYCDCNDSAGTMQGDFPSSVPRKTRNIYSTVFLMWVEQIKWSFLNAAQSFIMWIILLLLHYCIIFLYFVKKALLVNISFFVSPIGQPFHRQKSLAKFLWIFQLESIYSTLHLYKTKLFSVRNHSHFEFL